MELLLSEVWPTFFFLSFSNLYSICFLWSHHTSGFTQAADSLFMVPLIMQAEPKKICSQIGLCAFDGTRSVGLVNLFILYYYYFPAASIFVNMQ